MTCVAKGHNEIIVDGKVEFWGRKCCFFHLESLPLQCVFFIVLDFKVNYEVVVCEDGHFFCIFAPFFNVSIQKNMDSLKINKVQIRNLQIDDYD